MLLCTRYTEIAIVNLITDYLGSRNIQSIEYNVTAAIIGVQQVGLTLRLEAVPLRVLPVKLF